MKLDSLTEHLLEITSLNCEALKDVVGEQATEDARAQRVQADIVKACQAVNAAHDNYVVMRRDIHLEMKNKA